MNKCHDCGAKEGELHHPGCDMERCPACGGQAISCGCSNKKFYSKGYRIPYLRIPNLCRLCGKQWPEFFSVSDCEWETYVIPELQGEILCKECYERLKALFPDGWMNCVKTVKEGKQA